MPVDLVVEAAESSPRTFSGHRCLWLNRSSCTCPRPGASRPCPKYDVATYMMHFPSFTYRVSVVSVNWLCNHMVGTVHFLEFLAASES